MPCRPFPDQCDGKCVTTGQTTLAITLDCVTWSQLTVIVPMVMLDGVFAGLTGAENTGPWKW